MSRTEHHVGTAVAVATDVKGLRAKAKRLKQVKDIDILEDPDEEDDRWLTIVHPSYVYLRDRDELLCLRDHEEDEFGVNRVKIRDDGFFRYYDFVLSFYNGGGDLSEVLESHINKAEEKIRADSAAT